MPHWQDWIKHLPKDWNRLKLFYNIFRKIAKQNIKFTFYVMSLFLFFFHFYKGSMVTVHQKNFKTYSNEMSVSFLWVNISIIS